eukprot:gene17467-biopygen4998
MLNTETGVPCYGMLTLNTGFGLQAAVTLPTSSATHTLVATLEVILAGPGHIAQKALWDTLEPGKKTGADALVLHCRRKKTTKIPHAVQARSSGGGIIENPAGDKVKCTDESVESGVSSETACCKTLRKHMMRLI